MVDSFHHLLGTCGTKRVTNVTKRVTCEIHGCALESEREGELRFEMSNQTKLRRWVARMYTGQRFLGWPLYACERDQQSALKESAGAR